MKTAVRVSEEMVSFVGAGEFPRISDGDRPLRDAVVFAFPGVGRDIPSRVVYRDQAILEDLQDCLLVLVVEARACQRIFALSLRGSAMWHLPADAHRIALSIIECGGHGEVLKTLRLARSIELLCQLCAHLGAGELVPFEGETPLPELDVVRLVQARRIIDQRWREKLTIPALAREVGINRDKLVRGFRELYGTTIADLLSTRRLEEARLMLLSSDIPVASVAHRCSYLSNASFTRAFARRFGLPPTALRQQGVEA
ncbi:helix-turn-helix transcriptional regulator [Altererythrobacter sp. SALINAS58]|uniref:helix-turn-helix transcriptional regulator n=1 Tax=Alteripontixanthobacter muriae TaxID=2705546 RepID=UPI00157763A5|nr:AraC family transcriptional regulator [Alteripontixanthobacter muriae]NTZ43202.1 helix-turn-helix transcriptional regulator [Alteripontixanthobacter muriae]